MLQFSIFQYVAVVVVVVVRRHGPRLVYKQNEWAERKDAEIDHEAESVNELCHESPFLATIFFFSLPLGTRLFVLFHGRKKHGATVRTCGRFGIQMKRQSTVPDHIWGTVNIILTRKEKTDKQQQPSPRQQKKNNNNNHNQVTYRDFLVHDFLDLFDPPVHVGEDGAGVLDGSLRQTRRQSGNRRRFVNRRIARRVNGVVAVAVGGGRERQCTMVENRKKNTDKIAI